MVVLVGCCWFGVWILGGQVISFASSKNTIFCIKLGMSVLTFCNWLSCLPWLPFIVVARWFSVSCAALGYARHPPLVSGGTLTGNAAMCVFPLFDAIFAPSLFKPPKCCWHPGVQGCTTASNAHCTMRLPPDTRRLSCGISDEMGRCFGGRLHSEVASLYSSLAAANMSCMI